MSPLDEAQVVPVVQDEIEDVPFALWNLDEEIRGQLMAFNFDWKKGDNQER